MNNTKNYKEHGGDKWVVNGVLEVTDEGVFFLNGKPLLRSEIQEESVATTIEELKNDFNALIHKLKYAGLMEME